MLHESPTNCLPECGHAPSECSKLGKTRIIADAATGWLEMPRFLNRMFPRHSTRNRNGMLRNITYLVKQDDLLNAAAFFQERDYVF